MTLNLVTGGSGYFGSLLVRNLLEAGEQCRIFDISDAADRPAGVELIRGDVRNLEDVRRAMIDVTVVHHNVAQVPLAKDHELFESVNIGGTRNVLQAALETGVKKVVYTSSSAVFGVPKSNPVTEETVPKPGEAYGRAKLAGECVCQEFVDRGLDVTVVRPRTILGHGRLGIFQILFEWIYTGYNVPVLGKGDNLYQFVHADDLAEACIRAGRRPGPTRYNFGTDRFGTMRQALEALCAHAMTGSKVRSVPMGPTAIGMRMCSAVGLAPLGPYHAMMYGRSLYFDISKAVRELDFLPAYSNEEMLIQSYQWYLANRTRVLTERGASHHRSALKQGVLKIVKHLL